MNPTSTILKLHFSIFASGLYSRVIILILKRYSLISEKVAFIYIKNQSPPLYQNIKLLSTLFLRVLKN
jgi:hypothetical protein